ncbi:MAG TPA: phosphoenolpyruvate--protein phosphotransferase [Pirellulales bacterium]|jgi:phosphotransferase system enzyme I (PtsI)|nr:phosphoenolpyruvate--protein phosphotransferase [Pirellulales bacterium]
MRKGIGVSPGVAVGTAYCINEIFVSPDARRLDEGEALAELARFDAARTKTAGDLHALYQKVATQVGPQEAAIFRAHESILLDPTFTTKVRTWIVDERATAPAALDRLLGEYTALFSRTTDEYLKERLADVRDVIIRLSSHLTDVLQPEKNALPGPLVIVADELLPSQVVTLGNREVAGIVTQAGGSTSHAAILARSRGVPAVAGVRGILKQVKNGDTIVVDGREGHVLVNPDAETTSAYLKLQREFFDLKDALAENRDQPAVTADGVAVRLLANINNLADAKAAAAMGAAGVGLFRTEYLFLAHPDVPDEEEQLAAYREIIAASPNRHVTIRTLDLGGDKTIPYLGHAREANPFMGWRSIRLSFEHPEFFSTQIRAILRAAVKEQGVKKRVRMMFPMITTLEEMRRVRGMVRKARQQLTAEGKPFGPVRIGMMLEVPAAAVSIQHLLGVVNFVSIGSNDLVQYLMAADRDNPKVSHLCQPLSPAVLQVLAQTIRACREAHKPVTLCGEMAGSPRAFVLLFGMGLRSFSMSPAFIPTIKELTSHLTRRRAERIVKRALAIKTTAGVQRFMAAQIAEIAPNLKLLDTT